MKRLWIVMLAAAVLLAGCGRESASVGVIGGADGPTAIIVSSARLVPGVWAGIAAVIAVAVCAVLWILRIKKKRGRG